MGLIVCLVRINFSIYPNIYILLQLWALENPPLDAEGIFLYNRMGLDRAIA